MSLSVWMSTGGADDADVFVVIRKRDADRYPVLRHGDTVNSGAHTVHTGPLTPSALVFNALP